MGIVKKVRRRIRRYVQERNLTKQDVLFASFPKCGNTFCRFVIAHQINLKYDLSLEIDFGSIKRLAPALGSPSAGEHWPFEFPRFLKTHKVFINPFKKAGASVYIMRDPRDVMISYYHWMQAHKKVRYTGSLREFIMEPLYGIEAYMKHIASWEHHWHTLFKYEELMTNGVQLFDNLFKELEIENIDPELIKSSVNLSLPEKIKKVEEQRGNEVRDELLDEEFRHVRSGKLNQWKDVMTDNELVVIEELSDQFFDRYGYDLAER
ncbi:MAG: sulfotransferase domain-containing protein [Saprospiraceae bacterium]|nr:sulfotransferase domain-containing protein [Saprospiraceae bacterium]